MLVEVNCIECGAVLEEMPDDFICPDCGESNLEEIYECVCDICGTEVEGEPGDPCQEEGCEGAI